MGEPEYKAVSDAHLLAMRTEADKHEDGRPKLMVEIASERKEFPLFVELFGRPPHCDARVLHEPSACEYCARAVAQQRERELLGVRNTGAPADQPGRVHPCPAELARSPASLAAWGGNRPVGDVDYVASALRSTSTDLGYPGEDVVKTCPWCQSVLAEGTPCLCGGPTAR